MRIPQTLVMSTMFLLLGCRYKDSDLSHVSTLNNKAIRSIQFPHPTYSCNLKLNGLRTITPEDAAVIASWNPNNRSFSVPEGWVSSIYQYPKVVRDVIFDLGIGLRLSCTFSIELNGLTELSVDAARALSKFKGSEMQLNGLTELPTDVAQALVPKGEGMSFSFDGIQTLLVDSAAALNMVKYGDLSLGSVREMDTEVYLALGSLHRENFRLGVYEMTVEQARIIASWDFTKYVHFPNLQKVSYDHAQVFTKKFYGGYTFDVPDSVDIVSATVFYHWILDVSDTHLRRDLIYRNQVRIQVSESSPLRHSEMCSFGLVLEKLDCRN